MRLTLKQLKQLSVETVDGIVLGFVSDVIFETEGQLIVQYVVKESLLKHINQKEYLISRDQIVRFEEKRLLVDSSVKLEKESDGVKKKVKPFSPKPIPMRETLEA